MLTKRNVVSGCLGLAVVMGYGLALHGSGRAGEDPPVRSEVAQAKQPTKEQPVFDSYDIKARNPYGAKLTTQRLNPGGAFTATSIAIPAGQQLADHTSPSPALLLMIEGQARFSSGTEQINMTPGSVVHIPPAVVHRIDASTNSHFVLMR